MTYEKTNPGLAPDGAETSSDIPAWKRDKAVVVPHGTNKYRRALLPGSQRMEKWMLPVGSILHLVPVFLLMLGLYLFTDNAFGMQSDKGISIAVIAAVITLTTFMFWNTAVKWAGIVLYAAGAVGGCVWIFLRTGLNPFYPILDYATAFFNTAVRYMMSIGYRTLYVFLVDTVYDAEEEAAFAKVFFLILTGIVSAVIAACTAKKVAVVPLACIIGIDFFVIFMYNISYSKWGLAFAVAGICGVLCLKMMQNMTAKKEGKQKAKKAAKKAAKTADAASAGAEKAAAGAFADTSVADISAVNTSAETASAAVTEPKAKKRGPLTDEEKAERKKAKKIAFRGHAVGGISSAFTAVVILAIIALPAAKVKNIWKTYESIDTIMETIRAYEVALITGEDMQITDLGLTGAAEILEARSSLATPRAFTGKTVLEIQSNVNIPVYLRSWLSTTFTEDKWYVASDAQRSEYKKLFGLDFRAEDITYDFFRNLSEKFVRYNSQTTYANHEDDGYITSLISLKNQGVAGNILFLPSRMDSSRGLLSYGTLDTPYQKRWINYYDGVAYSRAFHKGAMYSTVAFLPIYKEDEWMQTFNSKLFSYGGFMENYRELGSASLLLLDDNKNLAYTINDGYACFSLDKFGDYVRELDDAGKEELLSGLDTAVAYDDYVRHSGIYLTLTDDEGLNLRLRQLALDTVFEEPLPETGVTVAVDNEKGNLEYIDVSVFLGRMLCQPEIVEHSVFLPASVVAARQSGEPVYVFESRDDTKAVETWLAKRGLDKTKTELVIGQFGMVLSLTHNAVGVTGGALYSDNVIIDTASTSTVLSAFKPASVCSVGVGTTDEEVAAELDACLSLIAEAENLPREDVFAEKLEDGSYQIFKRLPPAAHAVDVLAGDKSYIRTDYYIDNPEKFFAYLEADPRWAPLYYNTYAQRIAKYLADNMTYTLNPTPAEEGDTVSAVERFLFDTKEGYCVQYATAATLLLRSVGVPTRYVEGYIAAKFSRNKAEDKVGNYLCNVRDYNAHAWAEIYLPYYGWQTTEVTTPYYSGMYDPYETLHYTYHDTGSSGLTDMTPIDDTELEEEEETFWELHGSQIIAAGIAVLVLAVIAAVLWVFFAHQTQKRLRHQYQLRISNREIVPAGERRAVSTSLYENMLSLAAVFGMKPVTGETPASFFRRMDLRFRVTGTSAQEILPIVEKNEFSSDELEASELSGFAVYLTHLEDVIRSECNVFKTFWISHVLGLM